MAASQRTLRRMRLFAVLVVLTLVAACLYRYLFDVDQSPYAYARQTFVGLLDGCLIWGFELFFVAGRRGEFVRRSRFLTAIGIKAAIIVAILIFTEAMSALLFEADPDWRLHPRFIIVIAYALTLIAMVSAAIQVTRIIGGRVLANIVLGRYHRPLAEERVFLFLDLVGSTGYAAQMGDVGVQTLISRLFFDITEPILEWGGEIHRYVGDQVVVTWRLTDGVTEARCVRCYFAILDAVRARAGEYARDFGTVPLFRAGLHGGPVVTSECGDTKKEIVYFGDTVNTAARIEEACKALDRPFLVSGELMARIALPDDLRAESAGTVRLRGPCRRQRAVRRGPRLRHGNHG